MTPTFKALTPAGEWVEGDLMRHKRFLDEKPYIKSSNIGEIVWYEVLPETVCMATGRADSKGKMMYEGDFVDVDEWMDAMGGYSGIYRIEYNNVDCAFLLVDDRDMIVQAISFNEMDTYTLTGKNIHDKTEGK